MYLAAIDSKPIEDRPKVFETDEELQEAIEGAMDCLKVLLEQPSLRYSYIFVIVHFIVDVKKKKKQLI